MGGLGRGGNALVTIAALEHPAEQLTDSGRETEACKGTGMEAALVLCLGTQSKPLPPLQDLLSLHQGGGGAAQPHTVGQ